MNIQNIKQLIKETKNLAPDEPLLKLIQAFETFLELYEQRHQVHSDPLAFKEDLKGAYQRLWTIFDRTTELYGYNKEDLQGYFSNPANFNSEQWKHLGWVKEFVDEQVKTESSPRKRRALTNKEALRI